MNTPSLAKITMYFSDGKFGWSETYYTLAQVLLKTNLIDPISLLPATVKLAQARASMLAGAPSGCSLALAGYQGSAPYLEYIRISQVGQPRNTAFYDPQSGQIINSGSLSASLSNNPLNVSGLLSAETADNPYSAMEMLMTLSNGLTVKRSLSGIPDSVICDQAWNRSNSWYTLWLAFANALVTGGWGVASNSITANNASLVGSEPITGISQIDPLGRPTITIPGALSYATSINGCPDYRVLIYCYRSAPGGYPNLNGVYRVNLPQGSSAPAGTVLQIQRSFKPLNPSNYGSVMPYNGPFFSPIRAITLTRPVAKKRGRPFGLPRGRARVTR